MPIISKEKQKKLEHEFRNRFCNLIDVITARSLRSNSEGLRNGVWPRPETLCATVGTDIDIRLAVDDFKAILSEIRKLK